MFELNDDWSGGSIGGKELTDALFGSLASSGTSKTKRRKPRKNKRCQQKEKSSYEAQQFLEVKKAVREPTLTQDLKSTFKSSREKRRRKANKDEQLVSQFSEMKTFEDDQSASKFAGKKRKRKSSEDEQLTSKFAKMKRKRKLSEEEKDEEFQRNLFDPRKNRNVHVDGKHETGSNIKKKKRHQQRKEKTGTSEVFAVPTPKSTKLRSKMVSKMEGARFRWINEQLYTTTGDEAKELFQNEPELFSIYHQGFGTQVSKWPINPLDHVIEYVTSLPHHMVIADFGCGEARLAQSVSHTVHSFDLVACNSWITACDMAHVPLPNASVDVCVFCLSLMGTNITDFIKEGKRVLKQDGWLKICDVASRFTSVENFAKDVELFGFKLFKTRTLSKMFVDLEFRLTYKGKTSKLPNIQLKPCCYKRR